MFQLYDTTRRRLCIASFIAFGVLPTVFVAAWCISRHLSGQLPSEAHRLGVQLGLEVRLQGIQYPRPGTVLYEGLQITDPETKDLVLRCGRLHVAPDGVKTSGQRRPIVVLTATQLEIDSAAIERLWQLLQRIAEGHHGPLESDVKLIAGDMTLLAEHPQTFTGVEGRLAMLPDGMDAWLLVHLGNSDASQPVCLRVVRNRKVTPPVGGFEIKTGNVAVPCSLLALGCDALKSLGPLCRFQGDFGAYAMPDGWTGSLKGRLTNVDLDSLVTAHFPHRLSGLGDCRIESARFRDGRLEEAKGEIVAKRGMISRSLIEAAVQRGKLAAMEVRQFSESTPYDQLAFSFALDAQGIEIKGLCDGATAGTILTSGSACILGEPARQPLPIAALVQMLAPPNALQVPVGRETDWLVQHLPQSQIVSPTGNPQATPPIMARGPGSQPR